MPHAQLYIGTYETVRELLPEHAQPGNGDVVLYDVVNLKAEDARRIATEAYETPLGEERSIVVAFLRATREAQNALLKALEEPAPQTVIYIIVPRVEILLPTVRSRLTLIAAAEPKTPEIVVEFLKKTYPERIKALGKEFLDGKKSPEAKEKLERFCAALLDAREREAYAVKDEETLRDILLVRSYWDTGGASRKMLLEHVL